MSTASTIKNTLLATFITVAVVTSGLVGWGRHLDQQRHVLQQDTAEAAQVAMDSQAKIDATAAASQKRIINYDGIAGKNALEILRTSHTIITKTFSFGEQVQSIDGLVGSGPDYWTFYVNNKMSDVGAGSYITKATDKISWKLEQL